jgi:hypothetical protein
VLPAVRRGIHDQVLISRPASIRDSGTRFDLPDQDRQDLSWRLRR